VKKRNGKMRPGRLNIQRILIGTKGTRHTITYKINTVIVKIVARNEKNDRLLFCMY
jgi:hypothetical protein